MSNFECPHCGMVNIDCGRDNYKTPKEIELEEKLEKIKEILLNWDCECRNIILEIIEGDNNE